MNKKIIVFVFVFLFSFVLVGCTQLEENKSYFVMFDGNGGTLVSGVQTQRVSSNIEVIIPTYEKEGYIFDNWYMDSSLTNLYSRESILENDLYVYAKWIAKQYTIIFNSNGGSSVTTITQDYDTAVIEPTNPTKEGCTFNGWYSDSSLTTLYTFTTMPDKDITLYAKWTINQYTITFDSNEGSLVTAITQDYNTVVTAPTTPTRVGYTFDGWYSDTELTTIYTFTTMPAEDMTLYAKWTINQYKITFNSNEGSSVTTITQDYNSIVTEPTAPTRLGYTFNEWYSDILLTTAYTFTTMLVEDITLYAKWTINRYTITFDSNGGSSVAAITQDYNIAVTKPTDPTKVGYTFDGWYSDSSLTKVYTFTIMPTKDRTLYAKWTINQYTITFNSNEGSSVTAITQDYNTTVTAPTNPKRTGYTFLGWYSDTELTTAYTFTTIPAENITLHAKWKRNSGGSGGSGGSTQPISQYTISFNSNGGSSVDAITQDYNSIVTAPTAPTKAGYTFNGWYSDIELTTAYTFTTMPAKNVVLYTKWTINQYTITFDSNEGSTVSAITQDYNTVVTEPNQPIRTGYTFVNWYSNEELTTAYTFTTMSAENVTLYAKWTINQYTITFDSNEGSIVTAITQDYNSIVTAPNQPTRTGYTFVNWYSDEELTTAYTFTTMPVENVTLYAKWTINQYTISFNSNEGSSVTAITQDYNSVVIEPTSPTRDEGIFNGWYSDSELTNIYTFTTMPAEDITLYAKWTINQYTITFDSNEGSTVTAITQNYNSIVTAPAAPTKEGYTFDGWYSDTELTTIYTFTTMPAENVTLYAKWTINQYTITFDSNEGSTVTAITQNYNSIVTAPADPTKEGYTFNGWYSDSSLTKSYIFTTMPLKNIILYAKWAINKYTITFNSNGGSLLPQITQNYNTTITKPTSPTKEEYTFGGWYIDAELTQSYVFSTMPAENISLYAKWLKPTEGFIFAEIDGFGYEVIGYEGNNQSVVIPSRYNNKKVVSIGEGAFYKNRVITSINIPANVTSIGEYAFSGAKSLKTITFEEGSQLMSIKRGAFSGATSLRSIDIPSSVTSIGGGAFEDATSLRSINIPSKVTDIGDYAFFNARYLSSINVSNDNKNYSSIDGVLFNKNQTLLITYPEGNINSTYIIPTKVTSIGLSAFQNARSLISINIPSSVTSIGVNAFLGATSLASINIPSSVTSIGVNAFFGATSLASINLSNDNQYYSSIDGVLFNKDQTLLIKYPGSNTSLTYMFPSSVTCISENAFYGTIYLATITFENGSKLTSIGEYAFYSCNSLTSITIPSSVTSIVENAFYYCDSLTSIMIPSSIASIGEGAFNTTTSLTSINVSNDNQYYSSIDGVLFNKDKTVLIKYPAGNTNSTYVIPSSVTSIGTYAFSDAKFLTSINIPSSVTSMGGSAFSGATLLKTVVFEEGSKLKSIGDYTFYNNTSLTSITIPVSVTNIGNYTFYNNTSLTSIIIPASVTSMGAFVFGGTTALTKVTFEEGSKLKSIGNWAFNNCYSLINICIPESVQSIGDYAFMNCESLVSITIPSNVTNIGNYAFSGSRLLTVYTELKSKPEGWSSNWNPDNRPVTWGYIG